MNQIGLVVDTSSNTLYLGLAKNGVLIDSIVITEAGHQQSVILVSEAQKLIHRNDVLAKEVDYLVCGKGPGSYTGTRIGLTFAKTYALALDIPLYLYSSLKMLKMLDTSKPTICIRDARAKRSYVAIYQGEECLLSERVLTNAELFKLIDDAEVKPYLAGDSKHLNRDDLHFEEDHALENLLSGAKEENKVDPLVAKPFYIKESYEIPNLESK